MTSPALAEIPAAASPARVAVDRNSANWPLGALIAVAAALRFSTLGEQSFWYDEAYTPVHVLHASLFSTLSSMVHSENSPPVWYVLIWVWSRVFGTGEVALRSLSALAGVGLVAVAWPLGRELGTRTTAIVLAAIVAFNPLFIWYSQEARVYELFALFSALSLLFFLRARRTHTMRDVAWWSAISVLALATHYFAAFLVVPEAAVLLADAWRARAAAATPTAATAASSGAAASGATGGMGATRATSVGNPLPLRPTAIAAGAVALCGAALVPLVVAQGGHGTQWIGAWPLSDRLVAIPGYFLLGGQSSDFGHLILIACAAPILVAVGLIPSLTDAERRPGLLVLGLGVLSIAIPFALVLVGADYLAPRNLIASWVPLAAALAVLLTARRSGRAGLAIAAVVCAAGLAVVVGIDLVPRLQRGDWSGVARTLSAGTADRAVVTVELGAAPLEYYRPELSYLPYGHEVRVSEVDLVGYNPLRAGAPRPPSPAFHLVAGHSIHGLKVFRFVAASPQTLSETQLHRATITDTTSEVLVQGPATG